MKLVSYYILHTFKNSIKKIFKTWVAILILAMILVGAIIGITASVISKSVDEKDNQQNSTEIVEEQVDIDDEMSQEDIYAIIEMVAGGVVLTIVLINLFFGEKSGAKIFTMADVNFLFPSPRKPQSVLMFRVILQMGYALVGSIYLIFQLPNLILNLGLNGHNAIIIICAWLLILIIGKLISVCTYTLVATYSNLKKYLRPLIYGILSIILAIFLYFISAGDMSKFEAIKLMFASKSTRWVPIWGWMRGFVMYSIEGNTLFSLISLLAIILICALFIYVIWHIKADFYEDAFSNANKMQEQITAASEGRSRGIKRSKKIKSGEIGKGQGANIFLFKSLYNRKRSARFGFITKTLETYFVVSVLIALVTKFIAESDNIIPLSAIMIMIVFFRSFGNPIAEESSKNYLFLVPESPFKKLFYSLVGGTYDSFLNILPGYFISVLIIGGKFSMAISWFLLFITFDFMCSCSGLLIGMIIPSHLPLVIQKTMQIFLNMICIMVMGIIIAIGVAKANLLSILIFSVFLCSLIGIGLCYLSQKMLHTGKK